MVRGGSHDRPTVPTPDRPPEEMRIRSALSRATHIGVLALYLVACSDDSAAIAGHASPALPASSTVEAESTVTRITAPPTATGAPSATRSPNTSAPTSSSAPVSASDVFAETCSEMGPLFEARAELHASQADQNEFAEAMLQELRQSPEWDAHSRVDQAAVTKAVRAAANGDC